MNSHCGWSGTINDFLSLKRPAWLSSLNEHHQRCMNCPADESQQSAWVHSFDILQAELKKIVLMNPFFGYFPIIFEYELLRERGRRPDVIILGSTTIFVLEFKDYGKILPAHVDQVNAYARDLKHYHAVSHPYTIIPILVLTRVKDLIQLSGTTTILSANTISSFLDGQIPHDITPLIDMNTWITAEYSPLPSLIQAARTIWQKQPLPQIKRALSAGIPETIAKLIEIAQTAKENNELHLAFVTGVPGAGKTLVGIQLVYENHLDESDIKNNAVFLSGNGPLVKVLQYALKNSIFVQDVHGFLKTYGGSTSKIPHEHIWVYDEAQRAWDAERVKEKRGHPTSEPEDFLKLAERMNSWALMVALIGEGQEIHLGEESGLPQWNEALSMMKKDWIIHCPQRIAHHFSEQKKVKNDDTLDLTVTLRSHLAEEVAQWIKALLDGDLGKAQIFAESVRNQGFDVYITNDINIATNYVKERYKGQEDKRYGLLASSKAKNLPAWGIHNEFNYTKNMKEGPWYNDPPQSFHSCCALRDVATEFSSQGLELDFPIVCWGNDFLWVDNAWKSPPAKRSKAKNPHMLRMNSYRVLLTRGRDGFIIYVPNEPQMESTYYILIASGIQPLPSAYGITSTDAEAVKI